MNYVEWLRIRNCLRVIAIILAILVLLAVVLRISFARYLSPEAWISNMSSEPGTKTTQSLLPDGSKQIVIDNPREGVHAVITDRGAAGKHIVVTEPSGRAQQHDAMSIGSTVITKNTNGSMTTVTLNSNGVVPLGDYIGLGWVVALIVATILAAPFAREIDGHLEVAMTKPIARSRYALGAIGIDIVGMLIASLLAMLAFYLCQALFETPRLSLGGVNAHTVLMSIACPLAWYAMLCAATTWLHRSYGTVLGFAWPAAVLIGVLAALTPSNAVLSFIHDIAWVISHIDPLTYVSLSDHHSDVSTTYMGLNFTQRLSAEILLFLVYGALAVWQWQRVEA